MERLITKNLNTADEYNKIFWQRQVKGVDEFDLKRWKMLLKYWDKRGLCRKFHIKYDKKLVDLGALDSLVSVMAKAKLPDAEIWAIDIAEKSMVYMKSKYPEINFAVRDVYSTEFANNYFDYAVMGEVIEHLERPQDAIDEAMRILKPGGYLALSTPLEEVKEKGAVDGERHLWSFSVNDIEKLLKPYGKVKIKLLRSKYFPRYKYHWPNIIAWVKKK